jgi:hypothetical protein
MYYFCCEGQNEEEEGEENAESDQEHAGWASRPWQAIVPFITIALTSLINGLPLGGGDMAASHCFYHDFW